MTQPESPGRSNPQEFQHSFNFWVIIAGLGIMIWLAALENAVLTTAAPAILAEFPLRDDWIWLTNAFFLASAAFQPFLSQLFNLFGRRWITLSVISVFMLGSGIGICGSANNASSLIAGHAVQGVGSGGVLVAYDTIVSDLVPLRHRGNYIAIVLLIYSIGTTMGGFIGGVIVDNISWRWTFYINLPIGAISLIVMFFFLHVNHRRDTSIWTRIKSIDHGLFSRLNEDSPTGEWVAYMFTAPIGAGLLLNSQLPAFQVSVPEADQAAATGSWNFIRTLGSMWGVAIPAAIFGNYVDTMIADGALSNPVAAGHLAGGGAYQHASAEFVKSFAPAIQAEIRALYRKAIQRVLFAGESEAKSGERED
ncbi:hypothetical protein QQS21_004232 [Conoideocrella luteorostrata]|uniref:Major facilitator superfamily (MFS) profile domain-containing protein n=1 Tax=Conoideocrella luteorostrata TaxID=1105319 RepID=A0AAJ0FZY1_9HYPO|nr:hypothetical protein QQS21_004232 [Conoideocrella luteorostrata]